MELSVRCYLHFLKTKKPPTIDEIACLRVINALAGYRVAILIVAAPDGVKVVPGSLARHYNQQREREAENDSKPISPPHRDPPTA